MNSTSAEEELHFPSSVGLPMSEAEGRRADKAQDETARLRAMLLAAGIDPDKPTGCPPCRRTTRF